MMGHVLECTEQRGGGGGRRKTHSELLRNIEKGSMYVSCYWKIGETDEGMKAAKRADVEPW